VLLEQAMAGGDPEATWVMQGWLFYSERDFWRPPQVEVSFQKLSKKA
jgi:alpha-N-acetylglucosaminidase